MPGVSSILGGNTAGLNENTSSTAAVKARSQRDEAAPASSSQADAVSSVSEDRVELSDRAQKLQKLKEEFFPGGYRSIKITPAFVERLREYGFLSGTEAEQLLPLGNRFTEQQTTDELEELSQFVERLSEDLEDKDPGNSLIAILNKAGAVLADLDGVSSVSEKQEIQSVIAELSQYRPSEEANLSDGDKVSLRHLEIALRIAGRENQGSDVPTQIDRYLAILQQK